MSKKLHDAQKRLADAEGRVARFRVRLDELADIESSLLAEAADTLARGETVNGARSQRVEAAHEKQEIRAALPRLETEVEVARAEVTEAERAAAATQLEKLRGQAPKLDDAVDAAMAKLTDALKARVALIQPTIEAAKAAGVTGHPNYGAFPRLLSSWVNFHLELALASGPITRQRWYERFIDRKLADLDASAHHVAAGHRQCKDCGLLYVPADSQSSLQCPACHFTALGLEYSASALREYVAGARKYNAEHAAAHRAREINREARPIQNELRAAEKDLERAEDHVRLEPDSPKVKDRRDRANQRVADLRGQLDEIRGRSDHS